MTVLAQVILDKSATTLGSSIRYIDARAVDAADGEATAVARPARDRHSPANSPRKKQAQRIPGEIEASFRAATLAAPPATKPTAIGLLVRALRRTSRRAVHERRRSPHSATARGTADTARDMTRSGRLRTLVAIGGLPEDRQI